MDQKIFYHSVQGMRSTNEDNHIIFQNNKFTLLGVCDGHGGSYVSDLVSYKMPLLFSAVDFEHPMKPEFFKQLCLNIQNQLKTDKKGRAKECGSTCTMFLKYNNRNTFFTMNIGDSRIIACYKTYDKNTKEYGYKTIQLTRDHKPHDEIENKLITAKGGTVRLVEGVFRIDGLALSRCFGDCNNKHICCIPDIVRHYLNFSENNIDHQLLFVIIACDGLYDMLSNDVIGAYIINKYYDDSYNRIYKKTNPAKDLCQFALTNESTDNVSVIVKFFD